MNVENSDFVPQTGEGRMLAIPEIVRMVRRYVWLIVVLSVGMAILTYFWSRRQPKQYDSVALVKVDQHGQLSLASGVSFSDDYDVKVATEMLEVHSRDLALRVIERQHLEKNKDFNSLTPKYSDLSDPNAREFLTAKFLGALRVERVPKSELIAITFRSESPALSAQVANSVVDNYLEAHFLNSYQGTQAIKGWLTNELDGLRTC